MSIEKEIDVFIPLGPKDCELLPLCVDGIMRYVRPRPRNITIIYKEMSPRLAMNLSRYDQIKLIHEDMVIDGLRRSDMPSIVVGALDRAGWYFQQFIKFGVEALSKTDNYLLVDADVIFIKEVNFLDNGKYVFWTKSDVHAPYIDACRKLIPGLYDQRKSYTVDYMIFNRTIMSELIKTIERMGNMEKWYEIILGNFIDRKNSHSFSDYEMYARYMENNYSYRMHVIDQGADLSFSIFQPSRNRLLFLPPRYRQFHAILACIACWFGFSGISYPSHIDSISYLWRR